MLFLQIVWRFGCESWHLKCGQKVGGGGIQCKFYFFWKRAQWAANVWNLSHRWLYSNKRRRKIEAQFYVFLVKIWLLVKNTLYLMILFSTAN